MRGVCFDKASSLRPESCLALADALKAASATLQHLDLADNMVGPEGGSALAEALRLNASLRTLQLPQNKIGPEAAQVWRQAGVIGGPNHLDDGRLEDLSEGRG